MRPLGMLVTLVDSPIHVLDDFVWSILDAVYR